jgi:hypothetical protein
MGITDIAFRTANNRSLAAGACDHTLKDSLPDLVPLFGPRLRANPGSR